MSTNGTQSGAPDLGKAQLAFLGWLEPVIVLATMATSLYINRLRDYRILSRDRVSLQQTSSERTSEDTLVGSTDQDSVDDEDGLRMQHPDHPPKWRIIDAETSQATRFSNYLHSRIVQKFPFLVEMFYWILNYAAYKVTKDIAAGLWGFKGNGVTELAQDHGISILNFEHESFFSFFFSIKEIDVQRYLLSSRLPTMTVLNQIYSLVHIPGTVAYLSWYYYAAPNHNQFAIARRTMTLGNFVAFAVFSLYPCMPPRLLPKRFGFEDTVRQANAESVWVGDGKNVNQLAAMPSLHFTYALVVGCTFFWHSGFLQSLSGQRRSRSLLSTALLMAAGVLYPMLVLLVIVATANHYYLDAVVATFSVVGCFLSNRVWLYLLPAERLFCRALRLQKPIPTTGQSWHKKRGEGQWECVSEESEPFV